MVLLWELYERNVEMSKEKLFNKIFEEVKKNQKPAVPFNLDTLVEDDILGSKIHGTPYWEKGIQIPKSKSGKPLQLMAQINLVKMPELPHFPRNGILQFFLCLEDTYGLNFNNPIDHKSNMVIYWPNPSMENYAKYPVTNYEESPASEPLSIEPKDIKMEVCGVADEYNFEKIFTSEVKQKFPQLSEDDFFDYMAESDEANNCGSKMGGYAYFTQSDPRAYSNDALYNALGCKLEDNKEFVVLLQLDSDHESMMWGDCGVANWFILKEDLEKLDFTKVFYNWDCC